MKKLILALTIAAMGLFYSATAEAVFMQSTTGSMNIAATVLPTCTVSTTPMTFPAYDGTSVSLATSTITVNCSSTAPYRIDIDKGQNSMAANGSPRHVKTGALTAAASNTIQYYFYKVSSYTLANEWGDNGSTYCVGCAVPPTGLTGTGTGVDQVNTVYGRVLATTNAPGAYSDTVTVTVQY